MGKIVSRIQNLVEDLYLPEPYKVLLLGIDSAGKTTILYQAKQKEYVTMPTLGFNVELIRPEKDIRLMIWDVNGNEKIRRLWKYYYQYVVGIIFVIDCTDTERLEEVKDEIDILINSEELTNVPLVFMASKQDIPNSLTPSQIADRLELHKIVDRQWSIYGASGLTGDGVEESFKTMAHLISNNNNLPNNKT